MHPSILCMNIHTHTHADTHTRTNGQHRGPSSPHMLVFGLWEGAEVPGKNPGTHRKNIQPPQKKRCNLFAVRQHYQSLHCCVTHKALTSAFSIHFAKSTTILQKSVLLHYYHDYQTGDNIINSLQKTEVC